MKINYRAVMFLIVLLLFAQFGIVDAQDSAADEVVSNTDTIIAVLTGIIAALLTMLAAAGVELYRSTPLRVVLEIAGLLAKLTPGQQDDKAIADLLRRVQAEHKTSDDDEVRG